MSDFIIDVDAEGGRFSYGQKTQQGEKEGTRTLSHIIGRIESTGEKATGKTTTTTTTKAVYQASDAASVRHIGASMTHLPKLAEGEETNDWSDLDPLIRELGKMRCKPWDLRRNESESGILDHDGRNGVNALNPIMRDLTSASDLSSGEVFNFH